MIINAKMNYYKEKKGVHLCCLHDVVYDTRDDKDLRLQILMPYSCTFRKQFPCIAYVQGSGWLAQPLYSDIPDLSKIAERGFVIAIIEYRHSGIAKFPAQIIDCKTAIRFLKKHAEEYNIDANNIFVGGNSSGGHTAVMSVVTKNDEFFATDRYPEFDDSVQGVIDWYGPTEFSYANGHSKDKETISRDCLEYQVVGEKYFDPDYFRLINPNNFIDEKTLPPFLIFHGTNDKIVNKRNSDLLYEKLTKFGHEAQYVEMIDSEHGGPEFFINETIDIVDNFVNKNCK